MYGENTKNNMYIVSVKLTINGVDYDYVAHYNSYYDLVLRKIDILNYQFDKSEYMFKELEDLKEFVNKDLKQYIDIHFKGNSIKYTIIKLKFEVLQVIDGFFEEGII